MKVQYLYVPDVVSCRSSDRLADAGRLLRRAGIGAMPVWDDDDALIGIISERDLAGALADKADPVAVVVDDYATRSVAVAGLAEDSSVVGQRMLEAGIRHLPVLDGDRLVGMVSMRDLLAVESWA